MCRTDRGRNWERTTPSSSTSETSNAQWHKRKAAAALPAHRPRSESSARARSTSTVRNRIGGGAGLVWPRLVHSHESKVTADQTTHDQNKEKNEPGGAN